MLECGKCGSSNATGSNFCSNCGTRLKAELSTDTTRVIPVFTADGSSAAKLREDDLKAIEALPKGNALLVVTRGNLGSRYLLDKPVTTVGRHPNSDIFLDDITVSRHHAKLLKVDGQVRVEDQGSLNGTYVNRTLVDHSAALRNGDEVQVGKFRMVFFMSGYGLQ